MLVQQIAPGLSRWTGWHEEWGDLVGCIYYEGEGGICLIDPLVPPEESKRFRRALDRDVARVGGQMHVLITVFWHTRSARELVERYGARLWAPARARVPVERRAGAVTDVFRAGDALPGGIRAFASGRGTEVLYWLPEHRVLVPGDVILGADGGGLRLCPESWLPGSVRHSDLREAMRPLLELPVEKVLVSHGEPVLALGDVALARVLAAE